MLCIAVAAMPLAAHLQGTYFLVADIRPLAGRGRRQNGSQAPSGGASQNGGGSHNGSSADSGGDGGGGGETDVDFCQRLTAEAGVTLIPVSNRRASSLWHIRGLQ